MRISLCWSGSMLASASSVVTTTGKKHTSATITSLGRIPKPNQATSSGAIVRNGIAWVPISSG